MSSVVSPLFRVAVSPIRNVIVRDATASGDGSWIVEGYAAVFEQETVLYDGKWFRIREKIARDAFDQVLERVAGGEELVHLNHGHEMTSSVAATNVDGVGSLDLRADSHGLKFVARVDAEDPDAIRMATKMRRGVVAQASFAFTIDQEAAEVRELDDGRDDELWTIERVKNLYDVCVCAQGAYPQTESQIRSLAAASTRVPDLGTLGRSDLVSEGHDVADLGRGGTPVAPLGEGGEATEADDLVRARVDATYRNLTRRL
jgi:HK97 family phage prohead protease